MEMIELKHCFYPSPASRPARIYFEEKYSESVGCCDSTHSQSTVTGERELGGWF